MKLQPRLRHPNTETTSLKGTTATGQPRNLALTVPTPQAALPTVWTLHHLLIHHYSRTNIILTKTVSVPNPTIAQPPDLLARMPPWMETMAHPIGINPATGPPPTLPGSSVPTRRVILRTGLHHLSDRKVTARLISALACLPKTWNWAPMACPAA